MLIEYTATAEQDRRIESALKCCHISNWFNPEDDYYVMETDDPRVPTILALMGIDCLIAKE